LRPIDIYVIHKAVMSFLAVKKGFQKRLLHLFCGTVLLALGGCAQMQNISSLFVDDRALKANEGAAPAILSAQRLQKLEREKTVLAQELNDAAQATFLVQIEGGDITLNKTADLPSCQTAKAAISGMPGREKQAVPPFKSAFSVGSVSPYMPHHLLISTCLPLAMVAPL